MFNPPTVAGPSRPGTSADRSTLPPIFTGPNWPEKPPQGFRYREVVSVGGFRNIVDIVEEERPRMGEFNGLQYHHLAERAQAARSDDPSISDPRSKIFGPEPLEDDIPRESKQRASFEAGPSNPYKVRSDPDAASPSAAGRNDSGAVVYPTPREQPIPQAIPYEVWSPQTYGLHNQGWTVLDLLKGDANPPRLESNHESVQDAIEQSIANPRKYPTSDAKIWPAIDDLFRDAKTFFAADEVYKSTYGKDDSEEGWTKISGEKEFITIRGMTSNYTPNDVRNAAVKAWEHVFELLYEVLDDLTIAMKLPYGALQRYCESSRTLGQINGASMIRIFRYEYNTQYQILAEPHRDLGMLSLVIGDKPGLEVWNKKPVNNNYIPIETGYTTGMCTLMAGRQLEHFSNKIYEAAPHRVVSYGPNQPMIGGTHTPPSKTKKILDKFRRKPKEQPPAYRYSIVFVLRADSDVRLNYSLLSGSVCGDVTWRAGEGAPETAGELFERIRKAHFNVNTHVDKREKQKQKLTEIQKHEESMKEGVKKYQAAHADESNRKIERQHPLIRSSEDFDFAPPPHPPPSHSRTSPETTKHAQSDAIPQSQLDTCTVPSTHTQQHRPPDSPSLSHDTTPPHATS
jgi:hypothetical protein